MAIVGHNALLNQYVPTFFLKDLRDGQTIVFDARRKAFVNATWDSWQYGQIDKVLLSI